MSITDLYHQLFGKDHIQDGDVISFSEHGRVGGVDTGQGFKFVGIVDTPTEGTNASLELGYTDGNLTTITKTIGSTSYVKTLSYTGTQLDSVSEWVEV